MLEGCVPWPEDVAASYRRAGYWSGVPIGERFAAVAAARADAVALVDGERRITYAGLAARAERLAAGLLARGIRPGDRIVVQLPNVAELVELLLACLHAGVVPVLALPGHRGNEIVPVCRRAGAVAFVVPDRWQRFDHRELARTVCREVDTVAHVLVVGDPEELTALADVDGEPCGLPTVDAGEVALMLLSGGSTGVPKLIPRTHDDYAYNMLASAAALGVDEHGVYLSANPMAHNAALGCPGVLGTLLVGGRAVLAPNPSPDVAFALVEREGVTLTTLVPALVGLWLEAARTEPVDLGGMVLQVGSASFGARTAARVRRELGCRLTRWFGIAEGLLTYTRLDDPEDVVVGTDGRPLAADDEMLVVDPDGTPVPPGQVGELLTRGPYTIRGYYRAEAQNRSAFTADGFFRTGDLVRLRPDGNIEVCGRVKEIVNRGGEKVSSAEVEDHLAAHPDVREVAVVGVEDPMLGERVCAVLAVVPGADPRPAALKAFLRERGLASYKLPDQVLSVGELPHTAVGKVDKSSVRLLLDEAARAA